MLTISRQRGRADNRDRADKIPDSGHLMFPAIASSRSRRGRHARPQLVEIPGVEESDAALLSGNADSVFRKFGRPREPVGQQAVSRLSEILRISLSSDEIEQLREIGKHLSEDRVIAIALRTQDQPDMRSQ
jgi:hypothetical protein